MAASKFMFVAMLFVVLAASSIPTGNSLDWALSHCLRPCSKTYGAPQCNNDCIIAGFPKGDCFDKRPGAEEYVCCCPPTA